VEFPTERIVTSRPPSSTDPADERPSSLPVPPGFTASIVDLTTGRVTALAGLTGGSAYAASPDGTQVAYGTCCDAYDVVRVGNVDGSGIREITTPGRLDAYGAQWSLDGSRLVYQLRDGATWRFGSLVVNDLATGKATRIASVRGGNDWWFMAPSFSPDGRTVLYQLPRKPEMKWDVWSVPASGGTSTRLLENAAFARYFPDGERIVFVGGMRREFSGTRLVVAGADGTRRILVRAGSISWPAVSPDGSKVAYTAGESVYVVDVATGEATEVGRGSTPSWLDDETLLLAPWYSM
jgi:Tol biopolymer transport system component